MESYNEWEKLFQNAFEQVKKHVKSSYPVEDDGSGYPRNVALQKAVDQLPCAVKLLELEVDKEKYEHLEDDFCPIIKYDFEKMNQLSVEHLGKVKPSDKKFLEILNTNFNLKEPETFLKDFTEYDYTIKLYEEEDHFSNLQFLFYDPLKEPKKFAFDLTFLFQHNFLYSLSKDIEVLPNYNKIHGLKTDQIISERELLSKYVGMDSFVKLKNGKTREITVNDLQKDVAHLQLISIINEHVKRVFDRAKKLYIFGWYVYNFFPIAHHYAVLALESAIKHRYCAHFGKNVTVRNKLGNETKTSQVEYERIIRFCKGNLKQGWDFRKLRINDEKFLYKMNDLLTWLVENRIITKWERNQCEHHLDNRNYLSHPTFSPIYPAGTARIAIESVAYLINKMFSSLS